MWQNLKYLFKHSFIYSFSNAAAKAVGVVLLPIYSRHITITEFGILGIIEVTIAIFSELLNLGLGPALVMLTNSSEKEQEKKSVFFNIFLSLALISVVFVALGEIAIPYITGFLNESAEFSYYLRLALYVIVLRVLNNFFSDKLRADEKSVLYTVFNLAKLTVTLSLTVYFVAFAGYKITGVLYSYIIGEGLTFFLFLPFMFFRMYPKYNKGIFGKAVKFGFPLIFGSLAMMVLNVSDRYILKIYIEYSELGLYDLGYRIAGVINMFIIMPLSLALMPIAYKMYNTEGDKRYFSKIMTYLNLALVWCGLGISLFSEEIVKMFALNPDYWPAYKVVPVIVFSYVFFGLRIIANLGMFLTGKTKYVALTTIFSAALNIGLNFILIPAFGMIAAAYSTLISFFVLLAASYYFSNREYKIPYEHLKNIQVILIGVILYILVSSITAGFAVNLLLKSAALLIFPGILYILKFYEAAELEKVMQFIHQTKNRLIKK